MVISSPNDTNECPSVESEQFYHTQWPGLSRFDELIKNGAIYSVRSFPLVNEAYIA